jgi:hypothetical protein
MLSGDCQSYQIMYHSKWRHYPATAGGAPMVWLGIAGMRSGRGRAPDQNALHMEDMQMAGNEQSRRLDARARYAAKRVGLKAVRSRRDCSLDNFGEFMLIDAANNWVVAGSRFELTAEDVIRFCAEER